MIFKDDIRKIIAVFRNIYVDPVENWNLLTLAKSLSLNFLNTILNFKFHWAENLVLFVENQL